MSDFKMTYNEALKIQQAQLNWYRPTIGREGVKAIRARTACPVDLNPNERIDVVRINELVPRGGDIETYIKRIPITHDETRINWYNAIMKGIA